MNLLSRLTAFFFLGWLVAAVAFGAPTPVPGDEKFSPMVIGTMVCGEKGKVGGKWIWRGCTEFENWLSARVKIRCDSTGVVTELSCPGGATRVETVPR